MAGSKRHIIYGFVVVAHPDQAKMLRRMPPEEIRRHATEAQNNGQSLVTLDGKMYMLHRQSDHTLTLVRYSDEHRSAL